MPMVLFKSFYPKNILEKTISAGAVAEADPLISAKTCELGFRPQSLNKWEVEKTVVAQVEVRAVAIGWVRLQSKVHSQRITSNHKKADRALSAFADICSDSCVYHSVLVV